MNRMGNTGKEMTESGLWIRVGKKHYRHIDGAEIRYNCNRWLWEVLGTDHAFSLLWAARYAAEKVAA